MEILGGGVVEWEARVAEDNELQLPQALVGLLSDQRPTSLALAQKTLRKEEGAGTG